MNETVSVAIIVAIGTFLSPLLMVVLQWLLKRSERREDRAREDLVAERVETAAKAAGAVAHQAAEAATLLLTSNKIVAETAKVVAKETIGKLDVLTSVAKETHGLVNSQYTTVLKAKLDALETGVVLMKEIVAMNKAAGRDPNGGAATEIRSATAKINELKELIAQRLKADADSKLQPVTVVVQAAPADVRTADATERLAADTGRLADATEAIAEKDK